MNSIQHKKSLAVLEGAIVHFIVIGQFEIVAELCELLLECDDIFAKNAGNPIESSSTSKMQSERI
ncbi:MAG: hypothetical protein L3J37_00420 [Rhodobacteraceae bacterium]|nr:hypothetical protein [Paracoccaceae bacterium]